MFADFQTASYVEAASYELFLLELQVMSYELNFQASSYQKVLRVKP